jgi:hypothetical protein
VCDVNRLQVPILVEKKIEDVEHVKKGDHDHRVGHVTEVPDDCESLETLGRSPTRSKLDRWPDGKRRESIRVLSSHEAQIN